MTIRVSCPSRRSAAGSAAATSANPPVLSSGATSAATNRVFMWYFIIIVDHISPSWAKHDPQRLDSDLLNQLEDARDWDLRPGRAVIQLVVQLVDRLVE